jgi:hypothetical protein
VAGRSEDACGLAAGGAAVNVSRQQRNLLHARTRRQTHLQAVTNNTRFVLWPWVRVPGVGPGAKALSKRLRITLIRVNLDSFRVPTRTP